MLFFAELTSPFEDRVLDAQRRKTDKYNQRLIPDARRNGWSVEFYTVEVGSRGYVAPTLRRFFSALGFPDQVMRAACKRCSIIALRCSYILYLSRDLPDWTERPVIQDDQK